LEILATPRIGIRQSTDRPLRFLIAGNPFVSRPPAAPPTGSK
jgi:3-methyladenine DNA glycosylase Mpg